MPTEHTYRIDFEITQPNLILNGVDGEPQNSHEIDLEITQPSLVLNGIDGVSPTDYAYIVFSKWYKGDKGDPGVGIPQTISLSDHTLTLSDGGGSVELPIPSVINDLSDVSVSSPANGETLKYNSTSQKWENADNSSVEYGTTSYWNSRIGYIPAAGTIIVYTDYATKTVDNETVYIPNIKIGSGNGYVQDLAFVGEKEADDLISHISNTTIHVTAADKSNWNSKLNVDDNNEVVNETLIFIRN